MLSRWGDYYGVELDPSSAACKTGWVKASQLAVASDSPVKSVRSIKCARREPPKVIVDATVPTNKIAPSKFLSLKGKLLDDKNVKDMYILVNKEKVFYQAFPDNKGKTKVRGSGADKRKAEFEAILHLEKGTNNIIIVARDTEDFFDQHRMVILYKPEEKASEKISLR